MQATKKMCLFRVYARFCERSIIFRLENDRENFHQLDASIFSSALALIVRRHKTTRKNIDEHF